ncbi:MAG: hypothetical protein WCY89_01280 [Flavobacteriaceae bacterium]
MKKLLVLLVVFFVSFSYAQTGQKTIYFNKFAIDDNPYTDYDTEATFFWKNKDVVKLEVNSILMYYGIIETKQGIYDDDGDKFDAFLVENAKTEEQSIVYLYHNPKYGMTIKQEDGSIWRFYNSYHSKNEYTTKNIYEQLDELYQENQDLKEEAVYNQMADNLESENQAMMANAERANIPAAVRLAQQDPANRAFVGRNTATIGSDNNITLEELDKSWLGKQYDSLVENKEIVFIVGVVILFIIMGMSRSKK